jgi:hypothetical protein
MPTKISNTNTNINRININIPKQRQPKVTSKSVNNAEQQLQNLERQDMQYVSQAPTQYVNPSIFGFNTTPIQTPMQQPIDNPIIAQPEIPVAQAIPMNIEERGIKAQVFMPTKSDFEQRLSKQEGFQPIHAFEMPKLETRIIKKQGRPDINEMARNIIANRKNIVKDAGVSPSVLKPLEVKTGLRGGYN